MIRDTLIPLLQTRFPDRGMKIGLSPKACVTFPALHPEVGPIEIYDDGDELTLVAGRFTHGHFSNYDDISLEEKERAIAEDVASFLDRLFSDQVVLWGSQGEGGGWKVITPGTAVRKEYHREYVWSGPR